MKRRTRFKTWCKRDPDDDRKINYEFKTSDGRIFNFTSEDTLDISAFMRVSYSWIDTVELVDNEWYVVLYEDSEV